MPVTDASYTDAIITHRTHNLQLSIAKMLTIQTVMSTYSRLELDTKTHHTPAKLPAIVIPTLLFAS